MTVDYDEFARRYVELWNEADADLRRREIAEIFAPDVMHCTKSQEARGHAEMEQRVIGSHVKWVRDGGYRFAPLGRADGHHDVVRLCWQMIPGNGGAAASLGSDVLILLPDGRIKLDYQFVDQS
jgi:hypothetical protein